MAPRRKTSSFKGRGRPRSKRLSPNQEGAIQDWASLYGKEEAVLLFPCAQCIETTRGDCPTCGPRACQSYHVYRLCDHILVHLVGTDTWVPMGLAFQSNDDGNGYRALVYLGHLRRLPRLMRRLGTTGLFDSIKSLKTDRVLLSRVIAALVYGAYLSHGDHIPYKDRWVIHLQDERTINDVITNLSLPMRRHAHDAHHGNDLRDFRKSERTAPAGDTQALETIKNAALEDDEPLHYIAPQMARMPSDAHTRTAPKRSMAHRPTQLGRHLQWKGGNGGLRQRRLVRTNRIVIPAIDGTVLRGPPACRS